MLIPYTKTPLFHPLSKVQLEPGTEMDRYIPDESWLIQKHRDALSDFSDLSEPEKEYCKQWDAFILPQHLSSEEYLPRAFLAFVKENAKWFVAKPSRAQELGNHMQVLLIRNCLDEEAVRFALDCLDEARNQALVEEPSERRPKKRDSGCAVCGKMVSVGPRFLACTAAVSGYFSGLYIFALNCLDAKF